MTTHIDLHIRRGSTFTQGIRWHSEKWLYAAIDTISKGAPVAVTTTTPHGIPNGWEVAVVDAVGMTQLNATGNPPKAKDMRRATFVGANVIEFNPISSAAYPAHRQGTGYLAWLAPKSLAGCAARMQIRDSVGGNVLFSLTSAPGGGILLDDVEKAIEFTLTAEQAESAASASGVHDLEIVSPGGIVTALIEGAVTFGAETTVTQ